MPGAASATGEGSGVVRAVQLLRAFYPVLMTGQLGSRPRRVTVWGRHFVVFRPNPGGAPIAFVDRCPHRNVPLSLGRVCDGQLECPYHGWKFDGEGGCTEMPARVLPVLPQEARFSAAKVACEEAQGLIWVCPSPLGPLSDRFTLPTFDRSSYGYVLREVEAQGSLYSVIENALDVPHTRILHSGYFRTRETPAAKRHRLRVLVRKNSVGVVAEYQGEPPPRGLLGRILGTLDDEASVQHWDRFYLPSVLEVEYRLGERTHIHVTAVACPVGDYHTKLFASVGFRTPLPRRLVQLFLEPLGRIVFAQDAKLLLEQTRNIQAFGGEHFVSTEMDAVGPWMLKLLLESRKAERAGLRWGQDGGAPELVAECEIVT